VQGEFLRKRRVFAASRRRALCFNAASASLSIDGYELITNTGPPAQQGAIIMDESKALTIVSALANGVNPITGEIFTADSLYQSPEVVRALYSAARALEIRTKSRARPRTNLPANAGKPWSEEEDQKLLAGFDRGQSLPDLALTHGRTPAGIQARLERHGRLQVQATGKPSYFARGEYRRHTLPARTDGARAEA
jgi:hypothetical protein